MTTSELSSVPDDEQRRLTIRLRPIVKREARFQSASLAAYLDGQFAGIRERMRSILARPEMSYRYPDMDEYREVVLAWTRLLAAEGLGRIGYPKPYGHDDPGSFVAAFAMLGHHDLSLLTKFGVQFGLFGGAIARLGTGDHHHLLDGVASLAIPGCFAMTETGHGSNVRELQTIASYDGGNDELVITTPNHLASKDYIGNAAVHGRMAVVFARLIVADFDHGVHAMLVPIRQENGQVSPGVRIEDSGVKAGLNGVDNGRIWFDHVRIPRSALLDRFAVIDERGTYHSEIPDADRRFFTTIGTLVGGRIAVGSAAINAAKSALTIAIRYAHRRRQFGPTPGQETLLIDYPTHQQRLMPRLAATYAYHFAFDDLIEDYASGTEDPRRLEATVAALKAYGTWHAIDTIDAARQACGAQGYLAVNRLPAMRSDLDVFTTYEGDNTVLSQLVAKALLLDFKQEFEKQNLPGLARRLARLAASLVKEANPLMIARVSAAQIRSRDFQLDLLRWRERHQLEALGRRIKRRVGSGMSTFDAFVEIQDHAAAVARSHADRIVLEAFDAAVGRCENPALRVVLDRLATLHGLTLIRDDLGWFQEHGRLSRPAAKLVRRTVAALSSELARESLALVDAFAIPDQVLAAPIALGTSGEPSTEDG